MTVDEIVKVTDAIARLVGALAWPAILAFVLYHSRSGLAEFFSNLAEISFKGAGVDVSAKVKQREIVASLTAAAASTLNEKATPETIKQDTQEAFKIVNDTVNARLIRQASRAQGLWVDDIPANNTFERQSLETLGISFVLSTSTDEALRELGRRSFDIVISDMSRPPDGKAGYTLLDAVKARGIRTPVIIYASSRSPEHVAEAKRRGAFGCTNRANELFQMTLSALNLRQ